MGAMNDETAAKAPETTATPEETRPGYSPYKLGIGIGLVLTLAAVLLFLSFISLWVDRQIFDQKQWTETSAEVIQRPAVKNALANYLVDELFNNVNVETEIKDQLPSDWEVLASPATSALRSVTLSGTKKLLELPVTEEAWEQANAIAHQALITTLEGGTDNVSTENGTVTINAQAILQQAAQKLGLSGNLVNKIPAGAGTFVIYQSDDLSSVQSIYKGMKDMVWAFVIATILLYALAIMLAKGRRRRAVLWMGGSFVIVGLLVLIAISLGRTPAIGALAQTESVKPAVGDIYDIATAILGKMADSLIFTGVLVLLAGILAGPYAWAISTRRFLAPYLRDYLALSTAVAVLLFLILLWIAPVTGFRTTVGLVINVTLAVAGFVALVSITRHEFPDAEPADFGAVGVWFGERYRDTRGWIEDVTKRDSQAPSVRGGGETTTVVKTETVPETADAPTEPLATTDSKIDELERLQSLHASGALNDAEFAAAKKQVLGG